MPQETGGTGIRNIVRFNAEKAPFGRVTIERSGQAAVVRVHTVKPDTFDKRRGPDLVPELERVLRRTVTVDVVPEAHAVMKFVRLSPTKAQRVMRQLQGMHVDEALGALKFLPNRAARQIEKLLRSAAANAFEGWGAEPAELKIALIHADRGPIAKRIRPRAMGRAYRVEKKISHLTVRVQGTERRPLRTGSRRGQAAVTRA